MKLADGKTSPHSVGSGLCPGLHLLLAVHPLPVQSDSWLLQLVFLGFLLPFGSQSVPSSWGGQQGTTWGLPVCDKLTLTFLELSLWLAVHFESDSPLESLSGESFHGMRAMFSRLASSLPQAISDITISLSLNDHFLWFLQSYCKTLPSPWSCIYP